MITRITFDKISVWIIVLLLIAGIAKAQTATTQYEHHILQQDTVQWECVKFGDTTLIYCLEWRSGLLQNYIQRKSVALYHLNSKWTPDQIYDSGQLEIIGWDTVKLIRYLLRREDSLITRNREIQRLADKAINSAVGFKGTDQQLKRWTKAVKEYAKFTQSYYTQY